MMDLSIFWARFLGLFFIFFGAIYLVRKDFLKTVLENYFKNPAFAAVVGILNLIMGLFIILSHNVWEFNWKGIITVFGYLLILRAILNLFATDKLAEYALKGIEGKGVIYAGVIILIIGLYLALSGFSVIG